MVDEDFDLDEDGVTICAGDCNDIDETIYIGAIELCDGLDNDCSADPTNEYDLGVPEGEDDDLDGYPSAECCVDTGEGEVCGDDCDDLDADINPSVEEVCEDGIDNNCNGDIDWDEVDVCLWEAGEAYDTAINMNLSPRGCSDCSTLGALSPASLPLWAGLVGLLGLRRRETDCTTRNSPR